MQIRAVLIGVLPPRPGGASVSVGQIAAGIARAGHEIAVIAPITAESLQGGDRYAAQHPELRILRYLMPRYYNDSYNPVAADLAAAQDRGIRRLIRELTSSFQPNLVIAGHEIFGSIGRELARDLRLPWCQWLRGSPTGQILAGLF